MPNEHSLFYAYLVVYYIMLLSYHCPFSFVSISIFTLLSIIHITGSLQCSRTPIYVYCAFVLPVVSVAKTGSYRLLESIH